MSEQGSQGWGGPHIVGYPLSTSALAARTTGFGWGSSPPSPKRRLFPPCKPCTSFGNQHTSTDQATAPAPICITGPAHPFSHCCCPLCSSSSDGSAQAAAQAALLWGATFSTGLLSLFIPTSLHLSSSSRSPQHPSPSSSTCTSSPGPRRRPKATTTTQHLPLPSFPSCWCRT